MLSNKGLEYHIEESSNGKVIVTFVVTGWSYETRKEHALKGAVRDPMDKYKYGVGFTGCGPFNVRHRAFNVWKNMFDRVYDNTKFPDYTGCSIDANWHCYQDFAKWYTDNHPNKEGYELDKDLLIAGNKVYSPNTCCIIPREINQAIVTVKSGTFPSIKKYGNKFRASVSMGSETVHEYFYDIRDAIDFYIRNKDIRVKSLADKYRDALNSEQLDALLNWSTKDRVEVAMK